MVKQSSGFSDKLSRLSKLQPVPALFLPVLFQQPRLHLLPRSRLCPAMLFGRCRLLVPAVEECLLLLLCRYSSRVAGLISVSRLDWSMLR
jgi:hypothetical protein